MKKAMQDEKSFSTIELKSFITVVCILASVILICGLLSYFIPQGSFLRDDNGQIIVGSYVKGEVDGIAFWRILSAPVRVFASEDAVTIIMISVFLLIMSGVFNLLDKTGGIKIFISRLMHKLKGKGGRIACTCTLIFMLFGSFFGMFEELVTLLPIVIVFMLSINLDTMSGLGACLIASCFGFSSAITNPFSVGLASQVAGISPSSGVWLRIVFFIIIYATLCAFLLIHIRKIQKNPELSPTYEADLTKRASLNFDEGEEGSEKAFKIYGIFFIIQLVALLLIASVRAISDFAIPILAVSFLGAGVVCGLLVSEDKKSVFRHIYKGAI
jgi:uncharacterized ion transporter superfamily protein YfcC